MLRKIKNFLYWGWTMRNDVDWDYSSLIQVMHVKLSRMKVEMLDTPNDYMWTTEKTNQARKLRTVVELSKRLRYDVGYDYYINKFYGKTPRTFGRLSKEDQKKFVRAYKKDDAIKNLHWEMFWDILKKYSQHWWV